MTRHVALGSRIVLALCGLLLFAGCGGTGVQEIEGAQRDDVLAYAEPATDNLLAALQAADYARFSRDLSPEMLEAMPEPQFSNLRATLDAKLGAYLSRQVSRVEQQGDFVAVIYDAQFEHEDHVTVRVVFDQAHKISGLWFDSPRLRQG